MEDLEKLFDSCDSTYLRKVPVSKLILAVTNEINSFNNKSVTSCDMFLLNFCLYDVFEIIIHSDIEIFSEGFVVRSV